MAPTHGSGAAGGSGGPRPPRPPAPNDPPAAGDRAAAVARAAAGVRAAAASGATPPRADPPTEPLAPASPSGEPGRNITVYGDYVERGNINKGADGGYSLLHPVSGWRQFGHEHKWPRRVMVGCTALVGAAVLATMVNGCHHSSGQQQSSAGLVGTGSQGTSSGSQVTPTSGAQDGFGSTSTTSTSTTSTAPAGTPAQFAIDGQNGPGSDNQYTGNLDSTTGSTQNDVFVKFVLPDGQDARFDANGSAQCNAKTSGNIPGQLNETRWIYCPSVPPNDAISLNAIWDNPDPGNTTVLVSANNGTGASKSSGVPTPPPDAKWENLGPIDVLSQSTASGPGD